MNRKAATAQRGGVLRRIWTRRDDESGNALVIAISAVLMVGLLMGVIFSSVMFSVGNVTANRAHAAARASAEGGAQQVARKLLQKTEDVTTACTGLTPPADAWVNYQVDGVWFKENEDDPDWTRCDNGGPGIPKLAATVKVQTTGLSHSEDAADGKKGTRGQQGNVRGDRATVELTFVRPVSIGLDHAVFGDQGVTTDPDFSVVEDDSISGADAPTVVSNGQWSCPSKGTAAGDVFALNGASIQAACIVDGDFYVRGIIDIGAKLEVTGNLYVNGDLKSTAATKVGKNAIVRGKLQLESTGHDFKGDLRVYETFKTTNTQSSKFVAGNFFFVGTVPGDADAEWQLDQTKKGFKGQSWNDLSPEARDALLASDRANWVLPSVLGSPEEPQTDADKAMLKYPFITKEHSAFQGFAEAKWADLTAGKSASGSVCSGEGYKKASPVVVNVPTIVDVTECDIWKQRDLHIKLNADLVIYANSILKGGSWSVTSGNSEDDDTRHTLYLISAPVDGQDSCLPGSGKTVVFEESGWSQYDNGDPARLRTKIAIYGAGSVEFHNELSNPMLGQIYGCTVNTRVNLKFAKAGPDLTDTLWDLGIGSVRDITDGVSAP